MVNDSLVQIRIIQHDTRTRQREGVRKKRRKKERKRKHHKLSHWVNLKIEFVSDYTKFERAIFIQTIKWIVPVLIADFYHTAFEKFKILLSLLSLGMVTGAKMKNSDAFFWNVSLFFCVAKENLFSLFLSAREKLYQ